MLVDAVVLTGNGLNGTLSVSSHRRIVMVKKVLLITAILFGLAVFVLGFLGTYVAVGFGDAYQCVCPQFPWHHGEIKEYGGCTMSLYAADPQYEQRKARCAQQFEEAKNNNVCEPRCSNLTGALWLRVTLFSVALLLVIVPCVIFASPLVRRGR